TALEASVIYLHVSFVSQYGLDSVGQGISKVDLIYHSIFILSLFFQIILAADALWHRNIVQIIALVIFNLLSLSYAGIHEDYGTKNATYNPTNPIFLPKGDPNAAKNYYEPIVRPIEYTIIALVS
ncbi:5492_t:CDS:2, partial [Scutellospora calospora]